MHSLFVSLSHVRLQWVPDIKARALEYTSEKVQTFSQYTGT